jgi:hypothetical protein
MKQNGVWMILLYSRKLSVHPLRDLKILIFILKFKKFRVCCGIHSLVFVIDKYSYGENQVITQTKKISFFVVFHRKCSILATFYNSQRNRKFAFLGKNPLRWQPFFGLVPRNLTVRELVYDKYFRISWRIYRIQ